MQPELNDRLDGREQVCRCVSVSEGRMPVLNGWNHHWDFEDFEEQQSVWRCERSDWSEDPDASDLQAANSAHGEGRKSARDLRFGKVYWMMCECMCVSIKRLQGAKYLLHVQSHGGLKWSMRAEERRKEKLQEPIRHKCNSSWPWSEE